MSYDVQQALGENDAVVESHNVYQKTPGVLVVAMKFRFKDGEIGSKDFYPIASEKSAQMTRKVLRACGFDMDEIDLGELEKNPKLLAGAPVRLVVEEHEWNGNITNRISYVNAIPQAASKNLLAEATKKLRMAKGKNQEEAL